MMVDFIKHHNSIRKELFIVNAPIAIRDDAYEHDLGIALDRDSDGNPIKYDPARRDNFGISILQMAKAYQAGLGFSLHSKSDLDRLLNLMESYLDMAERSRRYINMRRMDLDEIDLILSFGKNLVDIHSDLSKRQDLEIKRVVNNVGTMNINEVIEKVKSNKDNKALSTRAKKNIVRFNPLTF